MLQCVRSQIKTADEKLRNIGKPQQQSATVDQTQHFTFYKHQQQHDQPQQQQQQQQKQQLQQDLNLLQQRQQQQQEQQHRQQLDLSSETRSPPRRSEPRSPDVREMAERAIARQGRRDRQGSGQRAADELDRAEIKRRSRSEGPNRRVRQSMDEREGGKKQIFDGGGGVRGRRRDLDSPDSDDSDLLPVRSAHARYDSDSDSDPKRWTKNPLMVRKVRKSEKTKHVEKRMSGSGENGVSQRSTTRDSWTYYGNEDGSSGGGNSSSKDGSGSKGSSKYQKLEERRKKRINLAVTSDEENTPASRISRLRQRAIQSGLGQQTRSPAISQDLMLGDNIQWQIHPSQQQQQRKQPLSQPQQQQQQQQHQPYRPQPAQYQGEKQRFPASITSSTDVQILPRNAPYASPREPLRQSFSSGVSPSVKPRAPFSPPPSQNMQSSFTTSIQSQRQGFQPITKVGQASFETTTPSRPYPQQQHQQLHNQSPVSHIQGQKVPPARPPPPVLSAARQSFFSSPDQQHASVSTARAVYNSSPEVVPHVRAASADSILDTPTRSSYPNNVSIINPNVNNNSNRVSGGQSSAYFQSPRTAHARASLTPHESAASSVPSRSPTQFNEVVEMRLRANRAERPAPQPKLVKKETGPFSHSDDSLDELIESNIQYLDSEIDKASKLKKAGSVSVSRSSSLPDPRRLSGQGPPDTQHAPTVQVKPNSSIQFRVALPAESPQTRMGGGGAGTVVMGNNSGPPAIRIGGVTSSEYASYDSPNRLQPDAGLRPERKYSYDSRSRISRPTSEYFDRDDLSKSDSQLNAQVVVPSYLGNNLHPEHAYARGCVSDVNLTSNLGNSLQIPQADKGMFSDVEYDIEVSERVKKWEKFMKVQDGQEAEGTKKPVSLSTIQEKNEEGLMLPSEVRKSVLLNKQGSFGNTYPNEVVPYTVAGPKSFSSDSSINRAGNSEAPKMFAVETNAHRFFQVIQDPQAGPRLGFQSQSVSSVFHAPVSIQADPAFMSANDLRQKMLSNRQPAPSSTSGPIVASHQVTSYQMPSYPSSETCTPVVMRSGLSSSAKDPAKRGSKYQDELEEISNVKSDSVVSLRRRFDTDSATVTSDDDQRSVSTASAKLSRSTKVSSVQKSSEPSDWTSMVPEYQTRFKESDVWSPNLESTQGVPVSIERVTARTLQTIPFSEDPFWKEIEEMTTFDPSSMAGHLSVGGGASQDREVGFEPVKSQHEIELMAPQSSTLPSQPRTTAVSARDRLQRSKSLYTPNITPLTITVDKNTSSATSALDDVLEDIRSSIERKQLSPKKKALELAYETQKSSASAALSAAPGKKTALDSIQSGVRLEGGQLLFTNPKLEAAKKYDNGGLSHVRAEQKPAPAKQPMQFYQQQRLQQQQTSRPQQQQNRQSQMLQGNGNNYELDPNLLKQKLLSTGLVVETDTEEYPMETPTKASSTFTSYKPVAPAYNPIVISQPGSSYNPVITQPASAYNPIVSQPGSSSFKPINPRPSQISQSRSSAFTPTAVPSTSESLFTAPTRSYPVPSRSYRPGTSALDDIQQALAPFSATSYQPGPESLYGTSKFESFSDSGMDTTRGPHTQATSWMYQPGGEDEDTPSTSSSSTLQKVNESMDDLKSLAQNVERRINVIKSRLQSADEKSLDTVLDSLKKFTPETKTQDSEPESFEAYYTAKKSKLSDALSELDRIYNNLDLNTDDMGSVAPPERTKPKPYRPTKSSDFILAPKPKSDHLRPMQTRISSVYIPGLETKSKAEVDKETESEFDIISKSFQAIVDEVNKTTDMFSRAAEKGRPENTAPETQKQTFRITLKPGETSDTMTSFTPAPLTMTSSVASGQLKGAPPATAPKPQDSKLKGGGRFRSKLQHDFGREDDTSVKKGRSKSVPDIETNAADLLAGSLDPTVSANTKFNATAIPYSKSTPVKESVSSPAPAPVPPPTASTPPPAVRNRPRVRPVRDNRIIQDDRASRKDSGEKLGVSISPQSSPRFSRKIIYNAGVDLDVNIQPPKMFQDAVDDVEESNQPQASVKQQVLERFNPKPVESEVKPSPVLTPINQRKIPPPTAAKPTVTPMTSAPTTPSMARSEIAVSGSKGSESVEEKKATARNNATAGLAKLQISSVKAPQPAVPTTPVGAPSSSSTSSASVNLTPPLTSEASQPQPALLTSQKSDPSDADVNASGGVRGRRRLGMGVAYMMDKFSTGEDSPDRLKSSKRFAATSAPELSESHAKSGQSETGKDTTTDIVEGCEGESIEKVSSEVKQSANKPGSPKPVKSLALRRMTPVDRSPQQPPCDAPKSPASRGLERKVIDPEGKQLSSGTASPQPSSPSKPPQYPWKRQPSDPEKLIFFPKSESGKVEAPDSPVDSASKDSCSSPKVVSKVTKIVGPSAAAAAAASKSDKSLGSPKVVKKRVRPPNRRIQTDTSTFSPSDRPHSFHELMSCYNDADPARLRRIDRFRKSASVDEVNPDVTAGRSFRSETGVITLNKPALPQKLGEVVFKVDPKPKS
ncbi:uncharacterized protein LOC101864682 [Aplysia californica]|uniref:Uncharacterized protein LOC101864682 n=1 Tax=Aplysia californica TaxID=6500 RepID=A0ABM0JL62_APLCA|nr:uncharacterized protein LOC101864682 [Aplysia californica]